jgi:hypothetical protein
MSTALKAVLQLPWPDKDREEWFSLGENHEKVRGFGLHQLRNRCTVSFKGAAFALLTVSAGILVLPRKKTLVFANSGHFPKLARHPNERRVNLHNCCWLTRIISAKEKVC